MRGHATTPGGSDYTFRLCAPDGWENQLPVPEVEFEFTAYISVSRPDGQVTFMLFDISKYQGRFMNDSQNDDTDRDVKFLDAQDQDNLGGKLIWNVGNTSAVAKWKGQAPGSITVKLKFEDYAAYAKIYALFNSRHTYAFSETLTIPKDDYPWRGSEKGNKIADAWERGAAYDYHDPTWDRDHGGEKSGVKHGKNTGDGFNVLEEYRGFEINGVHTRLSPTAKEVFIYSSLGPSDSSHLSSGDVGFSHNLSGIAVYETLDAESKEGVMNFTRKNVPGVNKQYRIRVYADTDREGVYGYCKSRLVSGKEGECQIYIDAIMNHGKQEAQLFDPIIAHEVGHSVDLEHHHTYHGIASSPPPGEACVMIGNKNHFTTFQQMIRWHGDGFADFHARPWDDQDHWGQYKLHTSHDDHRSYSD